MSKSFIFFCGGLIAAAIAWVLMKFLLDQVELDWRVLLIAIAVATAFLAEKIAQRAAGVRLTWGLGRARNIADFLIYLLIWCVALYFSWDSIFDTNAIISKIMDVVVLYLFAGALFEILNLLKKGE